MRFGDDEVDAAYEKLIKPVVEEMAVPRVVNRIVHNDRIDQRILKEIQAADLAIADLTHARPSVYYEAGYAERSIPVIYTCRADHLSSQAPDHLRVHFDLATANCIAWGSPTDRTFPERLRARLRLVLRPILDRRARDMEDRDHQQAFSRLSTEDKLQLLRDVALEEARNAGWDPRLYKKEDFAILGPEVLLFLDSIGAFQRPAAAGHRLSIFIRPRITRPTLRSLYWWLSPFEDVPDGPAVTSINHHVVLISLARVLPRQIEMQFSEVARDLAFPEPSWTVQSSSGWPAAARSPRAIRLTLMSGLTSEPDLRNRLGQILPPEIASVKTDGRNASSAAKARARE